MLARLRAAGIVADSFGLCVSTEPATTPDPTGFTLGLRVLILIPRDIAEAEALLFEVDALAKAAKSLETIIIASSLSPRYVRALRGRIPATISLVDAPFSGTLRAAEMGNLSFFLGGRRDEIDRLLTIFGALGRNSVRMGGFGSGIAAKVLSDFLTASSNAITRIALDWAEAQGIDESRLLEMTKTSMGSNILMQGYEMADFGASNEAIAALMKDVEAALDAALAGAHLTPPRAAEQLFHSLKSRALH
jgi:3-hydroxyisobutyrate dehydrogenase